MPLELAEICEQAEDRWRRVPDRDSLGRNRRSKPQRILAELFADQHQSRAVLDGDIDIENRKVEVKRGVRRERVLGARLKSAPSTSR